MMESSKRILILFISFITIFVSISESTESVAIFPGVEIIESNFYKKVFLEKPADNDLFQRAFNYLKSHELKLELSSFVNRSDIDNMFTSISESLEPKEQNSGEARKNKGGFGYVLLMGGMLAKTMAALGFGGVAMLAMKALGASLAALMLSSIVGLKKLSEQGHHESHVQYVTADHHRKKRSTMSIT